MAVRQRLPFPLFLIIFVIVLMLAGFASACLTDHPEQSVERMLIAAAALPTPVEVLHVLALSTVVGASFVTVRRHPAVFQTFRL